MLERITTVEGLEELPEGSIIGLEIPDTFEVYLKATEDGWSDHDDDQPEQFRRWRGISDDGVPESSVYLINRNSVGYILLGNIRPADKKNPA